ncbi:MAG: type II secretion system F family protein [Candidatus Aenigmatarchaeota archaeon]
MINMSNRLSSWIRESRKREGVVLGSVFAGAVLILLNFLFVRGVEGYESYFSVINLIGATIALTPSLIIKYREYQTKKEIESRFPGFLRDITQATEAGMTLPQAIKNATDNQYGPLTPYVQKMAAQIDWGIPFDEVLKRFSDEVGSPVLKRSVSTIIEAHRSGGNVSDILGVVGDSILQIERIKEERKSHVYSQMMTGYTIFFVFLGVMIGLQKFLIPSLAFQGSSTAGIGLGGGGGMENLQVVYKTMFEHLIVIQGVFSGLAIGKMARGSLIEGLKHVVVLVAIGYTAFFLLL